ncbi:MAG: filamentous hemagglutinin N-terminal domain-containing protein, partial [Gallionella sp.]
MGRKAISAALIVLHLATLQMPLAYAAPAGGQVSAGAGAIVQSGATTTVNQTSQNLAINWQSFNIGSNEVVQFNQPNASSIALNRIIGQDP